jgi:hypothetical protein
VVWLEREKIGKELLSIKKLFTAPRLLINMNRNVALQRKGMEIATF